VYFFFWGGVWRVGLLIKFTFATFATGRRLEPRPGLGRGPGALPPGGDQGRGRFQPGQEAAPLPRLDRPHPRGVLCPGKRMARDRTVQFHGLVQSQMGRNPTCVTFYPPGILLPFFTHTISLYIYNRAHLCTPGRRGGSAGSAGHHLPKLRPQQARHSLRAERLRHLYRTAVLRRPRRLFSRPTLGLAVVVGVVGVTSGPG